MIGGNEAQFFIYQIEKGFCEMNRNAVIPNTQSFASIQRWVDSFSLNSFNNLQKVDEYVEFFDLKNLCKSLEQDRINSDSRKLERAVSAFEEKPYEPDYGDLCRLHWIILKRKAVNVLELGSGYSTAVMAAAMKILDERFGDWAKSNIRAEKPFHVFTVEEEQRFLEISRARLGSKLLAYATLCRSSVEVSFFDNRISTVYSKLPNISPDFIYLDGPSQFGTTQEVNGFCFASKCRMPMSSDILRFEFFLEPGTMIITNR